MSCVPGLPGTVSHDTQSRERLTASRHIKSGEMVFPCIPGSSPAALYYTDTTLSDVAVLYSYTVIHPNPKSGLEPFVLAYADFPEGVRLLGRLKCPPGARPSIGMALTVITTRTNDEELSYYFAPQGEKHHA